MKIIRYGRVSTAEQIAGLEAQERDLKAAGCSRLYVERVSSMAERPQLSAALDYAREGDTFVVTRLDRLARSTRDLLQIIERLEAKGVALRLLDFGGSAVDTQSPTGRLMLTMFGAFAQFERELIHLRMREGIQKAKAEGKYKGRAPTARAKLPAIRDLAASGMRPSRIASELNISRASVYRLLAEQG